MNDKLVYIINDDKQIYPGHLVNINDENVWYCKLGQTNQD